MDFTTRATATLEGPGGDIDWEEVDCLLCGSDNWSPLVEAPDPSASGEGVRELVFVALLGGSTTAAKAFLVGHLGFWIEKLPLSVPGGLMLFRARESYRRVTAADLARLRAETAGDTRRDSTARAAG